MFLTEQLSAKKPQETTENIIEGLKSKIPDLVTLLQNGPCDRLVGTDMSLHTNTGADPGFWSGGSSRILP